MHLDDGTVAKLVEAIPVCITAIATAATAYWSKQANKTAHSNSKRIEDTKKMAAAAILGSGMVQAPATRRVLESVMMGFDQDLESLVEDMKTEWKNTGAISMKERQERQERQERKDRLEQGRNAEESR